MGEIHNAKITDTSITMGDHGCLTFRITLEADAWTSDVTMMTKLDKRCKESPNEYICIEVGKTLDGLLANKRYTIKNKKLVSFRSATVKREMTDEQRAKAAERLKQARQSKSVH